MTQRCASILGKRWNIANIYVNLHSDSGPGLFLKNMLIRRVNCILTPTMSVLTALVKHMKIHEQHNCPLLSRWVFDPRMPISLEKSTHDYLLIVNSDTTVELKYCPFCGKQMHSTETSTSARTRSCNHLPELALKPGSSIRYRRDLREYWLAGHDSHMARLFYCPTCGAKLKTRKKDGRFYKVKSEIVARLAKRTQDITSVALAIELLGQPEAERKDLVDHIYPDGNRTEIGYKRILFYDRFEKTLRIAVIEHLDGTVKVLFYPKEITR